MRNGPGEEVEGVEELEGVEGAEVVEGVEGSLHYTIYTPIRPDQGTPG